MQPQYDRHDDEIDLVELVVKLAKQWKVFVFTVLVAFMVAIPVYVVVPITYTATYFHQALQPVQVLPLLQQSYLPLTRTNINERFLSQIKSPTVIEQSLVEIGLVDPSTDEIQKAQIINAYLNRLSIQKVEESFLQNEATLRGVEVSIESASLELATEFLTSHLKNAEQILINTLQDEVSGLRQLELGKLAEMKEKLSLQAGFQQGASIQRLQAALAVASELGIEESQFTAVFASGNSVQALNALPEDALYLLGTNALTQMIKVLQQSDVVLVSEQLEELTEHGMMATPAKRILADFETANAENVNVEKVSLLPDPLALTVESQKISLLLALVIALFLGVMLGALLAVINLAAYSYRQRSSH